MTSDIAKARRARQRAEHRAAAQRWWSTFSIRAIVRYPRGFLGTLWFVCNCFMPIGLVLLLGRPVKATDDPDRPGAA